MKAKCEQSWTPTKQMKAVGEAVWGGGGVLQGWGGMKRDPWAHDGPTHDVSGRLAQ